MFSRFSFRRLKRSIRFFFQRQMRGWDDADTWSLDMTIAKFALPRLKRFKEINDGYPYGLTIEEWNEILNKMIYALEFCADEGQFDLVEDAEERKNNWKRVEEGLELFGKYFRSLWW